MSSISSILPLSLFLALVLIASCDGRPVMFDIDDRTDGLEKTIVGGEKADKKIQQRLVRIVSFPKGGGNSFGSCTGSVMSKKYILTAAHCFYFSDDLTDVVDLSGRSYVLVGEPTTNIYYSSDRPNKYKMKNVYVDQRYDDKYSRNDVALIELEEEISQDIYFPMKLGDIPTTGGVEITVSGYGVTSSSGDTSTFLAKAQVLFQLPEVCNEKRGWSVSDGKKEFCSTSLGFPDEGKTATCFGDSGGPAMTRSGKKGRKIKQIGITSHFYGSACEAPGTSQYSMRLSYYKKMIKRVVKRNKFRGWKKL